MVASRPTRRGIHGPHPPGQSSWHASFAHSRLVINDSSRLTSLRDLIKAAKEKIEANLNTISDPAQQKKLAALYRQGKIFGAVYLGMGQEATSVGSVSLLREGDLFSTVARNLSAWFYRGVNPEHMMARWFGKDQAPSHGRELGLFLADLREYGIFPYHNGSMASWIPAGAGYALAFKMRHQPNVCLCFTGDGATSPGDFYEGLNFASIHKLPLVIICEVNQFAYSTACDAQMPVANVADRAPAFNIYAETAYGNAKSKSGDAELSHYRMLA